MGLIRELVKAGKAEYDRRTREDDADEGQTSRAAPPPNQQAYSAATNQQMYAQQPAYPPGPYPPAPYGETAPASYGQAPSVPYGQPPYPYAQPPPQPYPYGVAPGQPAAGYPAHLVPVGSTLSDGGHKAAAAAQLTDRKGRPLKTTVNFMADRPFAIPDLPPIFQDKLFKIAKILSILVMILSTAITPMRTGLIVGISLSGALICFRIVVACIGYYVHYYDILNIGQFTCYCVLLGVSYHDYDTISRYMSTLLWAFLFTAVLLSMLLCHPFVLNYMHEMIPMEKWEDPNVKKAAWVLTFIWLGVFAIAGGSNVVYAATQKGGAIKIIFNYVIPYGALICGFLLTKFLPMYWKSKAAKAERAKAAKAVEVLVPPQSQAMDKGAEYGR